MQGFYNGQTMQMAAACQIKPDHVAPISAATLTFFTGGGTYVSENGTAQAEKYYINTRPLEGIPSVLHPSKTTVYGAHFKA